MEVTNVENNFCDLFVNCSSPRNESPHSQKMNRVRQIFCESIRRSDQILSTLLEGKALTLVEYDYIWSERTMYAVANRLLDCLGCKPVSCYMCFLEALDVTKQSHLKLLLEDEDYTLDVDHKAILQQNFTFLKNNIMVTGSSLLDILFQEDVLDVQELGEIRSKATEPEKVNELLKFIFMTSHEQYQIFLDSLSKADHAHVYRRLIGTIHEKMRKDLVAANKVKSETAEIIGKLGAMTLLEPRHELVYSGDSFDHKNKLELDQDEPDGHNAVQNKRLYKRSKDMTDGKKPKVSAKLLVDGTRSLPDKNANVLDESSGELVTKGWSHDSHAFPITLKSECLPDAPKRGLVQNELSPGKDFQVENKVWPEGGLLTAKNTKTKLETGLPFQDCGEASCTENSKMGASSEDSSYNCTLLHVIPKSGTGGVSAIAVIGNELFVSRGKVTSVVEVYNSSTFAFVQNITIPDVKSIRTIVGCNHNICLYVSDSDKKNLHRYDVTKKEFARWSSVGDCYGLSVTRSYNLLATIQSGRKIQEYTTLGILLRTIVLDRSVQKPWHCVEVNSEQFVLCWDGAKQSQACVIDTNGKIMHSYGGPSGSDVGRMDGPRHIAIDKHNNVLIADQNNHRVVLLSPTLSQISYVIIPGQELNRPNSLFLDELNSLMYVGELTGGRLLVFKTG